MSYTLTPGSIASVLELKTPEGAVHTLIFMSAENGVQVGIHNRPGFKTFPQHIQDAVITHFAMVFALPLAKRGDFLKVGKPWVVAA